MGIITAPVIEIKVNGVCQESVVFWVLGSDSLLAALVLHVHQDNGQPVPTCSV